jgi:hypothetical protein
MSLPNKVELERAKDLSKGLRQATDALNQQVKTFESILIRLNMGVSADLETSPGLFLSFKKVDSRWGLYWGPEKDRINDPLEYASRSVRVSCCMWFPELLERLVSEVNTQLGLVCEAGKNLDEVLAFLNEVCK